MLLRWVLILGVVGAGVRSAPVSFTSGPDRVALIELFTSEGCSSCPPAERWLAERRTDPQLWKTFVPVSWHVDYWNRLGWPDRFSTREFTQREYAYAAAWRSASVYTPCFVREGNEWKPDDHAFAGNQEHAGRLTIRYDGRTARASFVPGDTDSNLAVADIDLHIALLGGGIQSKVTAGENSGATLKHEFVALKMVTGALDRDLPLPQEHLAGVSRYALAAWITRHGELKPLQAAGGWLGE